MSERHPKAVCLEHGPSCTFLEVKKWYSRKITAHIHVWKENGEWKSERRPVTRSSNRKMIPLDVFR